MADAASPALSGAAEIVAAVRTLAEGQGRDDLAGQLDLIATELAAPEVPVAVLGAPGVGRSSVINGLVGAPLLPVRGPDGTGGTAVATTATHGSRYQASIVSETGPSGSAEARSRPVDFGEATALLGAPHNEANRWRLRSVHLEVPAAPLSRGLTLLEIPGIDGFGHGDPWRGVAAMAGAAAAIVVAPAERPLAPLDVDLARVAQAMCRHVVVVLTGADRLVHRAPVLDSAQTALDRRGVSATVIAVDTRPYWTDSGGVPPGPDPGMQTLARHLADKVVLDREQQRIGRALTEAFWAADRLRLRLWAEEALIEEPGGLSSTIARLRGAAREAERLCAEDATWRRVLAEGIRRLHHDVTVDRHRQLAELTAILATHPDPDQADATIAEAIVRVQRVRTLARRAFARQVAGQFRDEWTAVVGAIDLGPDVHSLLLPRLERTGPPPATDLAAIALSVPGTDITTSLDRMFSIDTDQAISRLENDLATRCRARAIELHRSLIEVLTALTILRDADLATREARRDTLASGLALLDGLQWPGGSPAAPD